MSGTIFRILTVNAGSSSIKLALFEGEDVSQPTLEAAIDDIGQPSARFSASRSGQAENVAKAVDVPDHVAAAKALVDWLTSQLGDEQVSAIGHRIVHGGPDHAAACLIDAALVKDLRELTLFDPEHLPTELQLIEAFKQLYPACPQIACFDTGFHHDLPTVAQMLPIPRRYTKQGLRRYGFHGLSYASVVEQIRQQDGDEAAQARLVIAHLGSGVSLAAISGGKSVDTTMGLTPASGVPMSSRSGDIDPGLAVYLARKEAMSADAFSKLVNFESGLLGMSETTADMEQLLQLEATDSRAKDAVDLFCYQIRKSIGSLAATLGGLDRLVFTGGMGEKAPKIRARICQELAFLGVQLDDDRNNAGQPVISPDASQVRVCVVHANEAATMAKDIQTLMQNGGIA